MSLPTSKFPKCFAAPFILLLCASSMVAQTDAATTRATAERLFTESKRLVYEGSKESLQQALQKLAEAQSLFHALNEGAREASALTQKGFIYGLLGEKQKALDYFSQALPLWRAAGERSGEAITLNNIGGVYGELGEYRKAIDYYNQALPILHALGDREREGQVLNNISGLYARTGAHQQALYYYNQTMLLRRAALDFGGAALTLNNMGVVYSKSGEKQKALAYYEQALVILRSIKDRKGEAVTLVNIGDVYNDLGQNQKAFDYYNQSLPVFLAVGDRYDEAITLLGIAVSEREMGRLNDALTHTETAIAILESLRTKIGSQELRSSYFATVQGYYVFYIDLLMRLHKQQPNAGYDGKALQASERGRARSLLELLTEAGADIRQGVDPQLVDRERALQQQLNRSAQRQMQLLRGPHTEEQAAGIAKEIESLTTQYQQVETQIRQASPHYAALTQPQPLTASQIQTTIVDKDTLLLEYSLGEQRSFLWAITPSSITSFELPGKNLIEAAARDVYDLLKARNTFPQNEAPNQREARIAQADARYPVAAGELSRIVLGPIANQLGKKRLVIVSDGALQYVPFAALLDPTAPAADRVPLVANHEIVNLPSASTIAVLRKEVQGRQPARKALAVLADPVFQSTDERLRTSSNTPALATVADLRTLSLGRAARDIGLKESELNIPRLLGTRNEARQILSLVPESQRKEAMDFAANRTTATSSELSEFRYVHFATHGFLDSTHPELSGIVLSMVDEKGNSQDGFLRAHEVFNLKLPAELVVLSACQTGLGKEVKGEGLVGLTRGFMYAGALRVVVSLWSVDDASTAELMARFYRGMLRDKLTPVAALRAAQISLMKEKNWQAPYYWAAFTLQGEWQ